jgi:hypothetical protein
MGASVPIAKDLLGFSQTRGHGRDLSLEQEHTGAEGLEEGYTTFRRQSIRATGWGLF